MRALCFVFLNKQQQLRHTTSNDATTTAHKSLTSLYRLEVMLSAMLLLLLLSVAAVTASSPYKFTMGKEEEFTISTQNAERAQSIARCYFCVCCYRCCHHCHCRQHAHTEPNGNRMNRWIICAISKNQLVDTLYSWVRPPNHRNTLSFSVWLSV